jgi:DNA-binding HxlR family transcriptional regulator
MTKTAEPIRNGLDRSILGPRNRPVERQDADVLMPPRGGDGARHRRRRSADRPNALSEDRPGGTVSTMHATTSPPVGPARAIHSVDPPRRPNDFEMVRGTQTVLGLLAGKWSIGVLYLLAGGTRRYSEVFYEVGEVSKKALTQTLRTLEHNGLITRRAYAEMPMRVEYSLTKLGWSITGLLMTMYEWADEHEPQLRGEPASPVLRRVA